MPTYVYECDTCQKTFEVEQRMSDDPLTSCECAPSGRLKRLIQPTAVMFKGTGFHINDYSPKPAAPESCPAVAEGGSCGCAAKPD